MENPIETEKSILIFKVQEGKGYDIQDRSGERASIFHWSLCAGRASRALDWVKTKQSNLQQALIYRDMNSNHLEILFWEQD